MGNIKFGTDGIRGVVNEDLTAQVAYKVGVALSLHLLETKSKPFVVIGEDTRKSCSMLKSALIAGLTSFGVDCVCFGVLTTPALAYLTRNKKADAGVMITASHNNSKYNGFKIFDSQGVKIDIKTSHKIENLAEKSQKYKPKDGDLVGSISNDKTGISTYIAHLKKRIKFKNMKVCFDCANGATNYVVSKIFGSDCIICGNEVVSELVNQNCGATNICALKEKMKFSDFDYGFAFDGDGDRVVMLDKFGNVFDGDTILFVLAMYYKKKNLLTSKTVVGTVVTNYGVEKTLLQNGINLERVQVGDKYIYLKMQNENYLLGGEQSGHIIIKNQSTTGDGVLIAIILLNIVCEIGGDFYSLVNLLQKYKQISLNVDVKEENKNYIIENFEFNNFLSKLENEISYSGRILVRASGTESVIRILVEGEDEKLCKEIADKIKNYVETLNEN